MDKDSIPRIMPCKETRVADELVNNAIRTSDKQVAVAIMFSASRAYETLGRSDLAEKCKKGLHPYNVNYKIID